MRILLDKVWADLWDNKGRTLQVVLIIAVGAFAIGMIIGTRNFMIEGMRDGWRASAPAMISLWASPGVDDDTLLALGRVEGITAVEGYMQSAVEWRLSPADPWRPGGLTARDRYDRQTFAKLERVSGDWPERNVFAVGQGGDTVFGVLPGSQVTLRIDNHETTVRIGGVIYDPVVQPPSFGGHAQFYTTRERFGDLVGEQVFNRILASAAAFDRERVTAMADAMQDKLERQDIDSGGASPYGDTVSDPDKHFFQDALDGIFLILGIMAGLALLLGLFLVYNTVTAIINRQVNQIGVLKAIGAGAGTVFAVYLLLVITYGVLALTIALPLGALGASWLGGYLMDAFNAEGEFQWSTTAVLAQVGVALLSPVLASLVPLFAAARITVREAISTYGLTAKPGVVDRGLARLRWLPQLFSLTVSNTFRHKRRVLLTQVTLVLSGLIFMTVMSARDSTRYTFDDLLFSILRFDVNFQFTEQERIGRVEELTLGYPGVEAVEMWELANASLRLAGKAESNQDKRSTVFGVPLPTTLYGPQLQAGRWLRADDTHAVVLNEKLAEEAGLAVGDVITFDFGVHGEFNWQVVGLIFDPIITNSAHVPRGVLLRDLHHVNRASTIWIQLARDDAEAQKAVARELRELYREERLRPYALSPFGQDTAAGIVANVLGQFEIIVTLLATMAVVIGLVGSIALAGVLSLNVLERRREIGVLRAVGATSGVIAGLFVGEGLILGWLSWLIALPLSMPASRLMVEGLSSALRTNLVYQQTPAGALLWLAIITVLSVVAALLPARAATRISVRDSLAYE